MKKPLKNKRPLTAFFFLLLALLVIFLIFSAFGTFKEKNEVVVYVSHDQDYSEPILKEFERETGIKVNLVYDVELVKTVGLVNKLLSEKENPRADVFWNNEVSRTIVLKRRGVLEPYCSKNAKEIPDLFKDKECYWTGFAARSRVLIVNTERVPEEEIPSDIWELTDSKWKGKVVIANPLFGSTGSHFSALFSVWGGERAKDFFRKLKENGVIIAEGNTMVKDMVVRGEAYLGLTDTDDANVAITREKAPIKMVFLNQDGMGTYVFPNTVMLIKGGPNPENGKKLIDFLLSEKVEEELSQTLAIQIPLHPNVKGSLSLEEIKVMNVDAEDVYNNLEPSQKFLKELFDL